MVSTLVFVQWRVMDNSAENTNLPLIDPIGWESIGRQAVVSFYKRPVMQKAYPFYDIFFLEGTNTKTIDNDKGGHKYKDYQTLITSDISCVI